MHGWKPNEMQQTTKTGPFEVTTDLKGFTISRETGGLKLRPGEAPHAINLVQHALSLQDWRVLPETVSDSPIMIRFTSERVIYMSNKNEEHGEVCFQFTEGDELIAAINSGVNKFKDMHTLKGAGPQGAFHNSVPDPIIEGR